MYAGLYLILLFAAITCLLAGRYITRLTWRPDVEPYEAGGLSLARSIRIAVHPERFARPDRLRTIRTLNLVGAALLCGAVAVLAYDVASAISVPRGSGARSPK